MGSLTDFQPSQPSSTGEWVDFPAARGTSFWSMGTFRSRGLWMNKQSRPPRKWFDNPQRPWHVPNESWLPLKKNGIPYFMAFLKFIPYIKFGRFHHPLLITQPTRVKWPLLFHRDGLAHERRLQVRGPHWIYIYRAGVGCLNEVTLGWWLNHPSEKY